MRSMRRLRAPLVVTFSLGSLAACNEEPPRPIKEPRPSATDAPVPTASLPKAPAPTSEPTTMTEAHEFERDESSVNPKIGKKRVVYRGDDHCFTFGPEDERQSGVQFARQPVACPEGIESLLASCLGRLLYRDGDSCSCGGPEGNPPPPPSPAACPPTK